MSEEQIENVKQVVESFKPFVARGFINKPRVINPNINLGELERKANTFISDGETELPIITMAEVGKTYHKLLGRDENDGEDFHYRLFYDATFAVYAPTVAREVVLVQQDGRGRPEQIRRAMIPVWENEIDWRKGTDPIFIVAMDMTRRDTPMYITEESTGIMHVTNTPLTAERHNLLDSLLSKGKTKYGDNNILKQQTEDRMKQPGYGETISPPSEVFFQRYDRNDAIGIASSELASFGASLDTELFEQAVKRYVDLFEKTTKRRSPKAWRKPNLK